MSRRLRPICLFLLAVSFVLITAGAALAQPTPISCIGTSTQAYGVQDTSADFYTIPGNLNFTSLCSPSSGEELNNLCYRSADGLFYAVELTSSGNNGIVTIDADCDVSSPLTLSGTTLPSNIRFDAGDCLPDGSKMFINVAGDRTEFYVVDLDSLTVTKLSTSSMTWDDGAVNDWTYNPTDGKLYGGDREDGELAAVELSPDPFSPTSATRSDTEMVMSSDDLPSSTSSSDAYGGAWFNAAKNRLFLHRNSGEVYEIDVSEPSIEATYTDTTPSPNIPSSSRNDSAPCHCDTAYFIQDEDAEVYQCDPSNPTLSCVKICDFTGREFNNAGFSKADGLIYAIELTSSGNSGIVRMDPNDSCSIESASSNPLPTGTRFDAGDVSPDGSTLYVNIAGNGTLHIVDLTAWPYPTKTTKSITGASGNVHDWAYNPADGKLYGGDTGTVPSGGQLAVLTIGTTVTRSDTSLSGLPGGTAFGGAWFNSAGNLVLHRNDGSVYEIDVSGPTLLTPTTTARSSSHNEGAVCVQ